MTSTTTELVRHHPAALYEQIAAHLRAGILGGRFGPGDKLPSENELQLQFDVSRDTVRLALRKLAEQGLVVSRHGKGTFACDRKLQVDLLALRGFYDSLVLQGMDPETELLAWERGEAVDGLRLGYTDARPMALRRLYLRQGEPMAVVVASLPSEAQHVTRRQADTHPIYRILDTLLGWTVARAEMAITARQAGDAFASLLVCDANDPLLVMTRTSYLSDGTRCEHTRFHIRPENYEFLVRTAGAVV